MLGQRLSLYLWPRCKHSTGRCGAGNSNAWSDTATTKPMGLEETGTCSRFRQNLSDANRGRNASRGKYSTKYKANEGWIDEWLFIGLDSIDSSILSSEFCWMLFQWRKLSVEHRKATTCRSSTSLPIGIADGNSTMGGVVSERRQLSHDRRSWQEILRYHSGTLFHCEFACFFREDRSKGFRPWLNKPIEHGVVGMIELVPRPLAVRFLSTSSSVRSKWVV